MSSSHSSRLGYVMLLALLVLWPVTGLEIESDYEQARPIAERIMQRVGWFQATVHTQFVV